ncbi:S-layer homology domain-containing protein [Paenibacillus sp. SI8]|uniref:S-layer homology domain-containing protein n=1 Tax=unclassified Paenibacillus TaxID=185978 RepID=UPI0034664C67
MKAYYRRIICSMAVVCILLANSYSVLAAEDKTASTNPNLLLDASYQKNAISTNTVDLLKNKGFLVTEQKDAQGPRFLMGKLSGELKTDQAVVDYLSLNKQVFGFQSPSKQLSLLKKDEDQIGGSHYLYQQQFEGLPIYGKYIKVNMDKGRQISSITNQLEATLETKLSINTHADISGKQAIDALVKSIEKEIGSPIQLGGKLGDKEVPQPTAQLIIYPYKGITYLAYEIKLAYLNPSIGDRIGYVDAHTGEVVHTYSGIQHAGPTTSDNVGFRGDHKTLNIFQEATNNKYYLIDYTKPMYNGTKGVILTSDFLQYNGGPNSFNARVINSSIPVFNSIAGATASHAVDAHYNAGIVYDYYIKELGRNSIDGAGMDILSFVHVPNLDGTVQENAFWSDGYQAMFYGDGGPNRCYACALDVVAHEMTHGVTSKTAGLVYENQPGALNESFSDMMGAVIDADDWEMGEDVGISNRDSARSMADPHLYDQPAQMSEYFTFADNRDGDYGGVHKNSGIPNHAAYLIAKKIDEAHIPNWSGKRLLGHLAYQALHHLTPVSEFEDARDAFVAAVSEWGLANSGPAPTGLDPQVINGVRDAVIQAWSEVGLPYNSLRAGNDIVSFTIPSLINPPEYEYSTQLDALNHTVIYHVPLGQDVTHVSPIIEISAKASISPLSGTARDFSKPVTYTVTAENGSSQVWKVIVAQGADNTAPIFKNSSISRDNKTVTAAFNEDVLDNWAEFNGVKLIRGKISLYDNAALTNKRDLGASDSVEVRDGKLSISFAQPIPGPLYIRVDSGAIRNVFDNAITSPVDFRVLASPGVSVSNASIKATGEPGASISLYNNDTNKRIDSLIAGANGEVYFNLPPAGTYFVKQYLSGFDSLASPVLDTAPPTTVSFRIAGVTENSVSVEWDGATDNVAVAGYEVAAYNSDEGIAEAATVPAAVRSYPLQNLKPGTTYLISVKAIDTSGNKSLGGALFPAKTTSINAQHKPVWSPVRYVALGDSLAAGVTPQSGISKGYANFLADKLAEAGVLINFNKNFPVPGYTTADVLQDVRDNVTGGNVRLPTNPPIKTVLSQADIVTLDAGGNDLLKINGTNDQVLVASTLQNIRTNNSATIDEIKAINPHAQIYLMGYYNPFPRLQGADKEKAIALINALNETLQAVAVTKGVSFVPVKDVIAADELTFLPNPLNVHLSQGGYQAIADQFWNAMKDHLPEKASLTASDITQEGVTLTWTAASDDVGVTGYKIMRDGAQIATVTGNVYQVAGLTAGTPYSFKVEAFDASNNTTTDGPSASITTLTDQTPPQGDTQAPTWPQNKSLTVSGVTQTAATLTWTPASDNTAVTSYKIFKNNAEATTVSGSVYSYEFTNLSANTAYSFKVEAGDAHNNLSTDGPTVTVQTYASPSPGGGGGGGGGWISEIEETKTGIKLLKGAYTFSTITENGQIFNQFTVSDSALKQAFEKLANKPAGARTISLQTDEKGAFVVVLPFAPLSKGTQSVKDANFISQSADGYVSQLDISAWLSKVTKLGDTTDTDKVFVRLKFKPANEQTAEQLKNKALQSGASSVEIPFETAIDLDIKGKKIPLQAITNQLPTLDLEWKLKNAVDPAKAFVVSYNAATGGFRMIPSKFSVANGATFVKIPSETSGTIAVLIVNKSFTDLNGHWAQKDVELLASKLLIEGVSAGSFDPDAQMTRSQFITLLVRTLGLESPSTSEVEFTDVKGSDWFSGSVRAAVEADLVNGFSDGSFKPDAPITRSEMAVVLSRALKLKGSDPKKLDAAQQVASFGDRESIPDWAEAAISHMVETGIIEGTNGGNFAPNDFATRAQSAVMLKRMLQHLQLLP